MNGSDRSLATSSVHPLQASLHSRLPSARAPAVVAPGPANRTGGSLRRGRPRRGLCHGGEAVPEIRQRGGDRRVPGCRPVSTAVSLRETGGLASQRIKLNVSTCEGRTADRFGPRGEADPSGDAGRRTTVLWRPRRAAHGRLEQAVGRPLPDDPTGAGIHSQCGDHAREERRAAIPRHPAQGGQARSRSSSPTSPRRAAICTGGTGATHLAGRTAERREPSGSPPSSVPLTPFGQERRGA